MSIGLIPALMKDLLVVDDVKLSFHGLPTLVQRFPTGPICQTTVMVIFDDRHPPPTPTLCDRRTLVNHLDGVPMTHIVPITTITCDVHRFPRAPKPGSLWRYGNKRIDLNAVRLYYMNIIQLHACRNCCCDT
jgi:hypothetical protein